MVTAGIHSVGAMSLISGFAAVNQAEQAGGGEQRQLTLEAREARAITAWEQALALIAAQQDEEAQVGSAGHALAVLGGGCAVVCRGWNAALRC